MTTLFFNDNSDHSYTLLTDVAAGSRATSVSPPPPFTTAAGASAYDPQLNPLGIPVSA